MDLQSIFDDWGYKYSGWMDFWEKLSPKNFVWWKTWFIKNNLWDRGIFIDEDSSIISPYGFYNKYNLLTNTSVSSDINIDMVSSVETLLQKWSEISFVGTSSIISDGVTSNYYYAEYDIFSQINNLTVEVYLYSLDIFNRYVENLAESLSSVNMTVVYAQLIENNLIFEWLLKFLIHNPAEPYIDFGELANSVNNSNMFTFCQLLFLVYVIFKKKWLKFVENGEETSDAAVEFLNTNLSQAYTSFTSPKIDYRLLDLDIESDSVISQIVDYSSELISQFKEANLSNNISHSMLNNPLVFFPLPRVFTKTIEDGGSLTLTANDANYKEYYYAVGRSGASDKYYTWVSVWCQSMPEGWVFPYTSWDFNSPKLLNENLGKYGDSFLVNIGDTDYIKSLTDYNRNSAILISKDTISVSEDVVYSEDKETIKTYNREFENLGDISNENLSNSFLIRQDYYDYYSQQKVSLSGDLMPYEGNGDGSRYFETIPVDLTESLDQYYSSLMGKFPQISTEEQKKLDTPTIDEFKDFPHINYINGRDTWKQKALVPKSRAMDYKVVFKSHATGVDDRYINVFATNIDTNETVNVPHVFRGINSMISAITIDSNLFQYGVYVISIYPNELWRGLVANCDLSLYFGHYYEIKTENVVVDSGIISHNKEFLRTDNIYIYDNQFLPMFFEVEITSPNFEWFDEKIDSENAKNRRYILLMDKLPSSNIWSQPDYYEKYKDYIGHEFEIYNKNEEVLLSGTWPEPLSNMINLENTFYRWPNWIEEKYQNQFIVFYEIKDNLSEANI